MYSKINTDFDLPRTVLIEKLHPFIKIIMKSLECPLMTTELYHYGKDFIIYQESSYAGEVIFGIDTVLSRVLYFDIARLNWLENEAITLGIISRTKWHSLAMNYADHYVGERGGYITTTGLLFIPKSGKFELIKSLINFKKFIVDMIPTFTNRRNIPISDHLPVRKCKTSYCLNNPEDKNFIYKIVDDENYKGSKHFSDKSDFITDIIRWQNGEKNIMSNHINFENKSKDYNRGMYA